MASESIEISVVSPVYRTAPFLPELVRRIEAALDPLNVAYEIVLVNDACPEGSGDLLRTMVLSNPRLGIVDLKCNLGQHRALLVGLRWANGRYVAVLDSDLQDPPELIPHLYARANMPDAPDAVLVVREGPYEARGRLISSRILKGLLRLLLGLPTGAGSYCLLSRPLVSRLLEMKVREPYLLAMVGASHAKVAALRAPRHPRPAGRSSYTAGKRLKLGLAALEIALRARWGIGWRGSQAWASNGAPYTLYGSLERSRADSRGDAFGTDRGAQ